MWLSHSLWKASAWFPFLKKQKKKQKKIKKKNSLFLFTITQDYEHNLELRSFLWKQLIDSKIKSARTSNSSGEMAKKYNSNLTLKAKVMEQLLPILAPIYLT